MLSIFINILAYISARVSIIFSGFQVLFIVYLMRTLRYGGYKIKIKKVSNIKIVEEQEVAEEKLPDNVTNLREEMSKKKP